MDWNDDSPVAYALLHLILLSQTPVRRKYAQEIMGNLKLFKLSEAPNESTEDLRKQIFQIFGQMALDKKKKLDFLVDNIHQVKRPRDDRSPHPVIIQFTKCTFRQKIWKTSMTPWCGRKSFLLQRIWLMGKDDAERNFGHWSKKLTKMEKILHGVVQMLSSKERKSLLTHWKISFETPIGLSLSLQLQSWESVTSYIPVIVTSID